MTLDQVTTAACALLRDAAPHDLSAPAQEALDVVMAALAALAASRDRAEMAAHDARWGTR